MHYTVQLHCTLYHKESSVSQKAAQEEELSIFEIIVNHTDEKSYRIAITVEEKVINFEEHFENLEAKLSIFESVVNDTEKKADKIKMKVANINKHIIKVKDSDDEN